VAVAVEVAMAVSTLPSLTRSGYSLWARQSGSGDSRLRVVVGMRRGDVAVSNWIVTQVTGAITSHTSSSWL